MADKKDLSQNTLPGFGCPGKIELPTPEEKEALDAMRSIKERVRAIKKRLTNLNASCNDKDAEKKSELEEDLARLKVDWDKREKRRQETARERMILLGHEKG
jgi:hypothetical protein